MSILLRYGIVFLSLLSILWPDIGFSSSWSTKLLKDAKEGNLERIKEDVKFVSDLDVRDKYDNTPLIWAARRGNLGIVKILVHKGADINATNRFGVTPLMWATMRNHKTIVSYLLRKNARPNLANEDGYTPLMWAARKDYQNIAEILLSNGATIDLTNSNQKTAMSIAKEAGHYDMVKFLNNWMDVVKGKVISSGASKPFIARFSVDKPDYNISPSPVKWALVIGIEDYMLQSVPPAEFAIRDAQAIKRHLVAMGFLRDHIITLLGHDATRASIRDAVFHLGNDISSNPSPKLVVIYFSGHGAPSISHGTSYIVPWDGDPDNLQDTGIQLSSLYKKLDTLPANHIIVLLDACFSGAGKGTGTVFGQGKRPLMVNFHDEPIPDQGKLIVLNAAKGDEMASPMTPKEHGLFTYYLLKGLNGEAATNDKVTIGSLFHYVLTKVRNHAESDNFNQTPVLQPSKDTKVDNITLR